MIIFILDKYGNNFLDLSISCLVYKMAENLDDVLKCLVLPTTKYSFYCHRGVKKQEKIHF